MKNQRGGGSLRGSSKEKETIGGVNKSNGAFKISVKERGGRPAN